MSEPLSKKEQFKSLSTASSVALLFDTTYDKLSKIFYHTPERYQYREFELQKKNGGKRQIACPNLKIKEIQRKLADILLEIYKQKPAVHGFSKDRSIVTNALQHLDKKHILNIDLQDFFPSVHFGRVRNLFIKAPYSIPLAPATVLAHICCHKNALPQGAPTSPIITNMICSKMDNALQKLAQKYNCTYTRYADDITFSFSCKQSRLPREIILIDRSGVKVGDLLENIIAENGFQINRSKVRLCTGSHRFEVTGLIVNQFPNVRRSYVQQIKSMLYAWEEHGYEKAETEYLEQFYIHKRASETKPKYMNVIKGKLSFLHMVRGERNQIYINLAKRFNKLIPKGVKPLPFIEATGDEKKIYDSLWILETLYDNDKGEAIVYQGTGFVLQNVGMVTCAHVIAEGSKIFAKTEAYRYDRIHERYVVKVKKYSKERDIAVVDLISQDGKLAKLTDNLTPANDSIKQKDPITLFGFPAYKKGQTPYVADGKVASIYPQMGIQKFEIDQLIREGNSGGPILNIKHEVVGIAAEGAEKAGGNNAVIAISELFKMLSDEKV